MLHNDIHLFVNNIPYMFIHEWLCYLLCKGPVMIHSWETWETREVSRWTLKTLGLLSALAGGWEGGVALSCVLTVGLSIGQTSPVESHAECWGYSMLHCSCFLLEWVGRITQLLINSTYCSTTLPREPVLLPCCSAVCSSLYPETLSFSRSLSSSRCDSVRVGMWIDLPKRLNG